MEKLKEKKETEYQKMNELGMVLIPFDVRKKFKINTGDKFEIYESGKNIILKKTEIEIGTEIFKEIGTILDRKLQIEIKVKDIGNKNYSNHIIRSVDDLGRVVVPIEVRKKLGFKEGDKIKVCVKDDKIILIKVK